MYVFNVIFSRLAAEVFLLYFGAKKERKRKIKQTDKKQTQKDYVRLIFFFASRFIRVLSSVFRV